MTTADKLAAAIQLGAAAHQSGLKCLPVLDGKVILLLAHIRLGDLTATAILKAWRRGWINASRSASIAI